MTQRKPKQIVKLLRKADEEMAKGKSAEDFCQEEQISPATIHVREKPQPAVRPEKLKSRFEAGL